VTSRLRLVAADEPPARPGPDERLYLKPLIEAGTSLASTDSRLLAGTPARFGSVEVLTRGAETVSCASLSLSDLTSWIGRLDQPHAERVLDQLDRLSSPRAPFGGLAMNGGTVMGIVNATPDSFSDGGVALDPCVAGERGRAMAGAGAAILDIGGESTRPGAEPVSLADECTRILPVIDALRGAGAVLSIDSRNAPVMAAALDAGAAIVNDVSALTHDAASLPLVAERAAPVVLMHAQGDPRTMQREPAYGHVSLDIYDYLERRIAACTAAGIARECIAVDPGIGFGKTLAHNLVLLRDLSLFHGLGCPLLLGASRKGFIGTLSGETVAARRMAGSVTVAAWGARCGAHILRVHDVADTLQGLAVARAIEGMQET
jgi:dihydropteroate synthase